MEFIFIILSILKIILIIILSILAIALLLLALLLFVPIRYKIEGNFYDSQRVEAKVHWLFKFLQIDYLYLGDKTQTKVKILGIRLPENNDEIPKPEDEKKAEEKETGKQTKKNENKTETSINDDIFKPTDGSPEEFIEDTGEKIYEERETIKETVKEAYDKVKFVIEYADAKVIFTLSIDLLKEWYRKLKPSKINIYGEIGFENPSTTGQALGLLSVFMACTGLDIEIKPNFEKAIMDMNILVSGNLLLWHFIWPLLKYIARKPIRKLIKIIFFRKDV